VVTLDPGSPVPPTFRDAVGSALSAFLDDRAATLASLAPGLEPPVDRARAFTSGGKRLRPAFCAWGFVAGGGPVELPDAVVAAAASLDLLHVSALVHDDVMDAAESRRGVPAAHRQFEADHRAAGWRGDPGAFGQAGAILLGDLLLVWSEEMFHRAGLADTARGRARRHLEAMRTEVTVGQYLDVVAQAQDPSAISRAPGGHARLTETTRAVVTWKSASYTVARPLLIGACLAGASDGTLMAHEAFGQPRGRAFQYRDDVLGVFGDEALTGKQSGEDLREGKLTLLVAETFASAGESDAAELALLFGSPDLGANEVARARAIITGSGALDRVEAEIRREYDHALRALACPELAESGRAGLGSLARLAVSRDH